MAQGAAAAGRKSPLPVSKAPCVGPSDPERLEGVAQDPFPLLHDARVAPCAEGALEWMPTHLASGR